MSDVPQWLRNAAMDACQLFGVDTGSWHINLEMSDRPGHDGENNGACSPDAVYLNATLEFARDLANDETGQRVVLHEVGHVAHAQIDLVVGYIISGLPAEAQWRVREMYDDAVEQYLQRTTRAMVRAIKPPSGAGHD